MTPQTANLVTALLKLYFEGRPHGRNKYGENGSITCRCHKCQAWDAVEKFSQSDFDELEKSLEVAKNDFVGDAAARSKLELQSSPSKSVCKTDANESAIAGLKSLPSPPI
jgi:hypothetical protein